MLHCSERSGCVMVGRATHRKSAALHKNHVLQRNACFAVAAAGRVPACTYVDVLLTNLSVPHRKCDNVVPSYRSA